MRHRAIKIVVIVVLIAIGLVFVARQVADVRESRRAVLDVVHQFQEQLNSDDYDSAYRLMSSAYRSKWDTTVFKWHASEYKRMLKEFSKNDEINLSAGRARVYLGSHDLEGGCALELVMEKDEWKIVESLNLYWIDE